jgi:hypothetical protein
MTHQKIERNITDAKDYSWKKMTQNDQIPNNKLKKIQITRFLQ